MEQEWNKDNVQWQRLKSFYKRWGIEVEELADNIVRIVQVDIEAGQRIYNQKELYDKARKLYPEKRYKIRCVTFPLDTDQVTPEWIREQMELYGLKPKDLARQLAFSPSVVSELINGKRPLSSPVCASFYYYFYSKRLGLHLAKTIESLNHLQTLPNAQPPELL